VEEKSVHKSVKSVQEIEVTTSVVSTEIKKSSDATIYADKETSQHQHAVPSIISEKKSHADVDLSHDKKTTTTTDDEVDNVDTSKQESSILPSVSSETILKNLHSEALAVTLEDHKQQAQALRQEIENTLLKDIHTLDSESLKIRLIQLAAELYERTKWEGLRLHQSLKQVEYELSNKYTELLKTQRMELEMETSKKLSSLEHKYLLETSKKIHEYIVESEANLSKLLKLQQEKHDEILSSELKSQENKLNLDFETDRNNQLAMLKNEFIQSKMALQDDILKITSQLVAYENVINEFEKTKTMSYVTHQESAVLLALETALNTPLKSFKTELNNIQQFYSTATSNNNPNYKLIEAIITTLPSSITKADNFTTPPTIADLKYRFKVVRQEIRKVALSPPQLGNHFLSQSVGSVLAYISSPPEGFIKGDGMEEILSRTNFFLEKGFLSQAVCEIQKLKGTYSATLANDWIKLAEQRLVIDQAVKVLKANNILNHSSIATNYS
jgi:mitofilin